jgi:hypothetical protein
MTFCELCKKKKQKIKPLFAHYDVCTDRKRLNSSFKLHTCIPAAILEVRDSILKKTTDKSVLSRVPCSKKITYSLRPIILFVNIDVSRYILVVDTSALAKINMGLRNY